MAARCCSQRGNDVDAEEDDEPEDHDDKAHAASLAHLVSACDSQGSCKGKRSLDLALVAASRTGYR